jgi:hypothetical protein
VLKNLTFDTRAAIALTIIAAFVAAYFKDPTDDTMKGALIAAFAGAWGYYLGSSKGSSDKTAALAMSRPVLQRAPEPPVSANDPTPPRKAAGK